MRHALGTLGCHTHMQGPVWMAGRPLALQLVCPQQSQGQHGYTQKHTHLYSICLNIHTVVAAAKRHVHNGRKAENQGALSEQWVKMPPVDIQYHVREETVIRVHHSFPQSKETQTKATNGYKEEAENYTYIS